MTRKEENKALDYLDDEAQRLGNYILKIKGANHRLMISLFFKKLLWYQSFNRLNYLGILEETKQMMIEAEAEEDTEQEEKDA